MDQPAPLPPNSAELAVVERFAALIDGLCAALMAAALPPERERRTWLGTMFGAVFGTLCVGPSRRLMERVCADLRAMAARLRELAAEVVAGGALDVGPDTRSVGAQSDLGHGSARHRGSSPPSAEIQPPVAIPQPAGDPRPVGAPRVEPGGLFVRDRRAEARPTASYAHHPSECPSRHERDSACGEHDPWPAVFSDLWAAAPSRGYFVASS